MSGGDEDERATFALLEGVSQLLLHASLQIRRDGATATTSTEARGLIRRTPEFRRYASGDRDAKFVGA
jgi:hypothetical protein